MKKMNLKFNEANKYNICDLLLLDHSYLKRCIQLLTNENGDKSKKLIIGKKFLDALEKHSFAEEKCVYAPLENIDYFRKEIIEGKIEHKLAEVKLKSLKRKLVKVKTLSDVNEIELKVLAEYIEHHVEEEEKELIPQMRLHIEDSVLDEIGMQFMRLRDFSAQDLQDYPVLKREIPIIKTMKNRFPQLYGQYVQNGYYPRKN